MQKNPLGCLSSKYTIYPSRKFPAIKVLLCGVCPKPMPNRLCNFINKCQMAISDAFLELYGTNTWKISDFM